ncbi:hypothetical protein D3C85_881550 [compost metagenome]
MQFGVDAIGQDHGTLHGEPVGNRKSVFIAAGGGGAGDQFCAGAAIALAAHDGDYGDGRAWADGLGVDDAAIGRPSPEFVGATRAGGAHGIPCHQGAFAQGLIAFHDGGDRRGGGVVTLLHDQPFDIPVSHQIIEVGAFGPCEHVGHGGVVDAGAQDQLAIGVLLQVAGHGF